MSARYQFVINNTVLTSKAAAKRFLRDIRDSYDDNVPIRGDDRASLLVALSWHPEAEEKIGVGVDFFTVKTVYGKMKNRCFFVHRTDGSSTDFSFPACIDGADLAKDVRNSLRIAIKPQIIKFREAFFCSNIDRHCPINGEEITEENCHVDHCPPFEFADLVKDWLNQEGLTLLDVLISAPQDNQYRATMCNLQQRQSWCEFHEKRAKLRMLSISGNLTRRKS